MWRLIWTNDAPNPNHLALLQKGADLWNYWRMENPKIIPSLHMANLQGADLRGFHLKGAEFIGANQLTIYRQQSANLNEIVKLLAGRSINNFIEVTAKAESESMSEAPKKVSNYNLKDAQFGGGLVDAETVHAHQIGGNIHNYAQEQNLVKAAAEIRNLLQQLEQAYPTNTLLEKQMVVTEAIKQIESNPTLKTRVIGALKASGTEALRELVDHPLVNILLAALEGWQEP